MIGETLATKLERLTPRNRDSARAEHVNMMPLCDRTDLILSQADVGKHADLNSISQIPENKLCSKSKSDRRIVPG